MHISLASYVLHVLCKWEKIKLYCIVLYYYAQKGCLGMCEILTKNGRHFVIELISVEQGFKIK